MGSTGSSFYIPSTTRLSPNAVRTAAQLVVSTSARCSTFPRLAFNYSWGVGVGKCRYSTLPLLLGNPSKVCTDVRLTPPRYQTQECTLFPSGRVATSILGCGTIEYERAGKRMSSLTEAALVSDVSKLRSVIWSLSRRRLCRTLCCRKESRQAA